MKKTLYEILGVKADASREEIDAAYQQAAGRLAQGPQADPNAGVFLREAHRVLRNDMQRAAYDASLAARGPQAGAMSETKPASARTLDADWAGGWIKWVVAVLVLLAVGAWWRSRTPAPPPTPPAVSPVVIVPPARDFSAPPGPAAAFTSSAARTAEDVFSEISPSIVRVNVLDGSGQVIGMGSGVVIERETVITNCHVATRGSELKVRSGKETFSASVDIADEEFDLCRLRVYGLGAPGVAIGSAAALRTGQRVFAIGAPQGLDLTISDGIVSALREVPGGTVIQTTAPISPGSSGGGLFTTGGQLIGITTFQHRYGQNLNFALPADWIGTMQQRAASAVQPVRTAAQPANKSKESQHLIVGTWWCYGSVTGNNGEYRFEPDGRASIVMANKPAIGRYWVSGKTFTLSGGGSLTGVIESLTAEKMILSFGEGRRLICDRR